MPIETAAASMEVEQPSREWTSAIAQATSLRSSDWLLIAFFIYVPLTGQMHGVGFPHWSLLALLVPAGLLLLAMADARSAGPVWSCLRDWAPAPLVLLAYRTADWFPRAQTNHDAENSWINWDRTLLNDWGVRAGIEKFGVAVPGMLELAYLLLYTVPPLVILYFYIRRERRRLDDFQFPFLLGTLTTYLLLPLFPTASPRLLFAGQDLPAVDTIFRQFNVWILERCDIQSSVFPSGHVTVGFAAAFAMLLALPEYRRAGFVLLAIAALVLANTIYGRYHYTADGLAGLAISLIAASIVFAYKARAARRNA